MSKMLWNDRKRWGKIAVPYLKHNPGVFLETKKTI
jgi:hypothetical protein